ncbi:MAG TPA: SulP family inorganic anion transporter [Candidatus Dormibacteraeota bacterium]|nr:SulP family inorganic anion transporter [Candidatus Dormibacteraeota bacterium]
MSATARFSLAAGIYKIIPAVDSLRRYSAADARSDVVAGLTVAAVAVPQAMAYAMVAGVPAEYGLYTAIVMTAVGAVFDSSRQLINGPTNAISIAVLSAIALVEGGEQKIQAAILLAFMVGCIQLAITLCRLGDLTRYISHSVIVGFTVGAGGLLVLDQLKNILGMRGMGDAHAHFLYRFWLTLVDGGGIQPLTASIGLGTIALVIALRWLRNRLGWRLLPDLLIVVMAMAVLVAQLGLDQRGVAVVGEIPAKLPRFALPPVDATTMRAFANAALAIALLGLLEAVSMAKAIAAQTGQKLDMNQQCLSEGLANFTGSFFQCIPGSGSLTRSAINQQAGGVTQWSGVVSALAVAVIVVQFAPYARFIPRAALAGILMVSAWNMVDWRALRYHLRATRFDSAIVVATAAAAILISVEFCVLIGVLMSFFLAVRRTGRMLLTEFVVSPDGRIHERLPEDVVAGPVLIFGLEGEMFFGATAALERYFAEIEERVDDATRVVVLRMKRVRSPDAVGLSLLEGFLDRMAARHVHVLLCGVRPPLFEGMQRIGLVERLDAKQIFLEEPVRLTSTLLAVRYAYELIGADYPSAPPDAARDAGLYYEI